MQVSYSTRGVFAVPPVSARAIGPDSAPSTPVQLHRYGSASESLHRPPPPAVGLVRPLSCDELPVTARNPSASCERRLLPRGLDADQGVKGTAATSPASAKPSESSLCTRLAELERRIAKLEAPALAGSLAASILSSEMAEPGLEACALGSTQDTTELESVFGIFRDNITREVEETSKALAKLVASVEKRFDDLRVDLDMRPILLRCAEELGCIGDQVSRFEERLVMLENDSGVREELPLSASGRLSRGAAELMEQKVALDSAARRRVRFEETDDTDAQTSKFTAEPNAAKRPDAEPLLLFG